MLTRSAWYGPEPEPFDVIQTITGRQYEIIEVNGRRLKCRVLHQGATLTDGCKVFNWQWNSRGKPTKGRKRC